MTLAVGVAGSVVLRDRLERLFVGLVDGEEGQLRVLVRYALWAIGLMLLLVAVSFLIPYKVYKEVTWKDGDWLHKGLRKMWEVFNGSVQRRSKGPWQFITLRDIFIYLANCCVFIFVAPS